MSVNFGVLGEIDATHRGQSIGLGSPQQRALLGLLLLAGRRAVSIDHLVERMWGSQAEAALKSTVRTYVLRLRRAFADAGVASPVIETLSYGYRLVAPGTIDLNVFDEHRTLSRAARGRGELAEAGEQLRTALRQWRGMPLSGARAFFVDEERSRLDQLHTAALEERIQLDLDLGRGPGLETELLELVKRYPLRERLHEFLMLALYQNGRQADALSAYQRIRRTLNDELGVTPGPGLSEMQARILRGDPALQPRQLVVAADPRSRDTAEVPSPTVRPAVRQLPADTPDFTGRAELVARLVGNLTSEDGPVTAGLCGLEGAGKTTLAVRVAHLAAHHYPDGQLYADLRGDSGLRRVGDVLGRFLRTLGSPEPLPAGVVERAVLWRSSLAGRRVLIVIDGAASVDQIRLLRPATPGSSAIVTSIRSLDAAALQWEHVGALAEPEVATLFGKIIGRELGAGRAGLCSDLMDVTGGYAQFVRVAGRRVLDRPFCSLEEVVDQLREHVDAPDGIHEDYRRMRAAVERSTNLVGPEISTAFRFIGVAQLSTFTPDSVAALLDTDRVRSRAILHELADVHLLRRGPGGIFDMITPLRACARVLARENDNPEDLRAALIRMRSFYKESERNAKIMLDSRRNADGPAYQTHLWGGVRFADNNGALRWLNDNEVEIRMLTDQLLQYSPAHAPVVVSRVRAALTKVPVDNALSA